MIKYKYLPYNKNLKGRARKMRNEMTAAEKKLWFGYLRQDHHRWLRQKPIDNFIVDFYCSELKLIIEVDGGTHLENKDVFNDWERSKKLENLGLKILRFWNDDVINGLDEVANIIEEEIKKIKSPQPPLSRGQKSPQPPLIKGAKIPPTPFNKGGKNPPTTLIKGDKGVKIYE